MRHPLTSRLGLNASLVALRWRVALLSLQIHTHTYPMNSSPVSGTTLLGLLVRTGLAALAGGMIADGSLTGEQLNTVAGGVTIALVAGWSFIQKKRAAKAVK
jgi:hypothetical protein